ncbi:MAG: N-acetylmuramoyl-L-alanine amidase [Lachnospiraceae bacterium]|nr:N-acetylmuramoyl-L-alanine amidase [Lachnospiraceae bacterium]
MKPKRIILSLLAALLMLIAACSPAGNNKKESGESGSRTSSSAQEETSAAGKEETTTAPSQERTEETRQDETPEESGGQEETDPRSAVLENYVNVFVITSESGVNLREMPDTESRIVGMIPYHGGGSITADEGDWLKVVSGGKAGYIYAPLAAVGEEARALAVENAVAMARVTEDAANLRDAPSLESNVVGTGIHNMAFLITGENEDFYTIDFAGTPAYISKKVSRKDYMLREAELYPEEPAEEGGEGQQGAQGETTPQQQAQSDQVYQAAMNSGSAPQAVIAGSNGLTVCIDAGHQQYGISEQEPNGPGSTTMKAKLTSGTSGCATGIPEYQTTLAVALLLQNELAARGYSVVMIRTTNDCPVSNAERAVIANESGSNCFIRLHCNGVSDPNVTGIISYAPAPGNPYMDAGNVTSSNTFAALVNSSAAQATGAQDRGVIQDNSMTGINWCKVPVSIIEMGFSSNPTEDQLLNDPSYQALLVQGMANGIDAFFGR